MVRCVSNWLGGECSYKYGYSFFDCTSHYLQTIMTSTGNFFPNEDELVSIRNENLREKVRKGMIFLRKHLIRNLLTGETLYHFATLASTPCYYTGEFINGIFEQTQLFNDIGGFDTLIEKQTFQQVAVEEFKKSGYVCTWRNFKCDRYFTIMVKYIPPIDIEWKNDNRIELPPYEQSSSTFPKFASK